MEQNEWSALTPGFDSLRDQLGWDQLPALVAVVIGMSQILVSMTLPPTQSPLMSILAFGGFLLVALGVSEILGTSWFNRSPESEWSVRLWRAMLVSIAIYVVIAAGSVVVELAWVEQATVVLAILLLLEMGVMIVVSGIASIAPIDE